MLGYALFCSIVLIGVLYALALRRVGQPCEAANTLIAGMLLLVVAATPSTGRWHCVCAQIVLASVFAYYGVLLYRRESRLLFLHLSVPIVLAAATGFHTYGMWQKALISYFVIAGVMHHHIVMRAAQRPALPEPDVFYKRRKVYRIEPSRSWPRHRGR